jgi:uncharacterized protein (TIGR00369 family)
VSKPDYKNPAGESEASPAERSVGFDGKFDAVAFFGLLANHGHGGEIGIAYHAHGDDWVEVALPWRPELVGVPESGLLASGAIVSLIDLAAGVAIWIKRGEFKPRATLDLRIDYLRPAPKGETVLARCRCIKIARSVAFVEGAAHVGDPDNPIARAALTFMTT